ncbi:endonuclease/exonuclease/phosphatase family protein [Paenibacillus sp. Leaf72]|uniref:endonuclease/exonuclease/phosphatase family protein n=1 Tax=Paenibacillus sp. Leaf72 TaxID=1736234 RepID=UPI0006F546C9|nr:endonuclease/exonuclease/phosphatase family protein [Paenibacillus sp. Leaf72]KQO18064.1 hypothetical protein ASF12_05330 [Paenibacillus sp. Leaf72]
MLSYMERLSYLQIQRVFHFEIEVWSIVPVKFLFWNINHKDHTDLLVQLVKKEKVNVLLLAEADQVDPATLSIKLGTKVDPAFTARFVSKQKVMLFDNLSAATPKINEDKRVSSCVYTINGSDVLVAGVHLHDKYSVDASNLYDLAGQHRRLINKYNINKKIIVGDFNMNPYEKGIMGATGFNAIMCAEEIEYNPIRTFGMVKSDFYYNPSWEAYSLPYPNGTYFYRSKVDSYNPYWHLLDQVLVSYELLKTKAFVNKSFKIIKKVGSIDLLKTMKSKTTGVQKLVPNKEEYSDHLPISFVMNL